MLNVSVFAKEANRLALAIHHAHIAIVTMLRSRSPLVRTSLFVIGVALVVLSPLVGVIPGPGGIFVFAGGLALMLQNSHWAKRQFVHAKRRWPKFGDLADRGLRRASSARRRARLKQAAPR